MVPTAQKHPPWHLYSGANQKTFEHAGATTIAPDQSLYYHFVNLTAATATTTVQHQLFFSIFPHICFTVRLNIFLILF